MFKDSQEKQVKKYISKTLKTGRSPSLAEIGEACGMSKGGAQWHVDNLIGENVFRRDINGLLVEITS